MRSGFGEQVSVSVVCLVWFVFFFFFQAEDGIRDGTVTGVQTCALPISWRGIATPDILRGAVVEQRQLPVVDRYHAKYPGRGHAAFGEGHLHVEEILGVQRSEERRVGKECRSRWSPNH